MFVKPKILSPYKKMNLNFVRYKVTAEKLGFKKHNLKDKQLQTKLRREKRLQKIASYGELNLQLLNYFRNRKPKVVKTTNKTVDKIHQLFSIYPPKWDFDETKLSNKEYRENGFAGETKAVAKFWKVFPDVIDEFMPRINLTVKYPNNRIVYRGNQLLISEARQKPEITFNVLGGAKNFWSIIMVDPDTPLPPEGRRLLTHYLITNIPGSDIERGQTLADYIPAAPPEKSGVHRYVYIIFQQEKGKTDFGDLEMKDLGSRYINMKEFVDKYSLKAKGLCFFQSQFEEECLEIYKELGIDEIRVKEEDYPKKIIINERRYSAMSQ